MPARYHGPEQPGPPGERGVTCAHCTVGYIAVSLFFELRATVLPCDLSTTKTKSYALRDLVTAAKGQYLSRRVTINYNCTSTSLSIIFPAKTKFDGTIEIWMSKYNRLTFSQFMLAMFVLMLYCGQGRRRDRPRENPALQLFFKVVFYLLQLPFKLVYFTWLLCHECYLRRSFEKKKEALLTKIVAQVKFRKDHAEYNQDKCSICLEYFEEGKNITSLNCKHLFHNPCIGTWLNEKERADMNCPMCHKNIFELGDSTEAEIELINLTHINNRLELVDDPRQAQQPALDPEESLRRRIEELFPPRRIRIGGGLGLEEEVDGEDDGQNTDEGEDHEDHQDDQDHEAEEAVGAGQASEDEGEAAEGETSKDVLSVDGEHNHGSGDEEHCQNREQEMADSREEPQSRTLSVASDIQQ